MSDMGVASLVCDGHAFFAGDANEFFKGLRLLLKFDEVLVPGGIVASDQSIQFAVSLDRRNVGGLNSGSRRAGEDGVLHLIGQAKDGGRRRAEGFVDEPPAVGLELLLVPVWVVSECRFKRTEVFSELRARTLCRRLFKLSASPDSFIQNVLALPCLVSPVGVPSRLLALRGVLKTAVDSTLRLVSALLLNPNISLRPSRCVSVAVADRLIPLSLKPINLSLRCIPIADEVGGLASASQLLLLKISDQFPVPSIRVSRRVLEFAAIPSSPIKVPISLALPLDSCDPASTNPCSVQSSPSLILRRPGLAENSVQELAADAVKGGGESRDASGGIAKLLGQPLGGVNILLGGSCPVNVASLLRRLKLFGGVQDSLIDGLKGGLNLGTSAV